MDRADEKQILKEAISVLQLESESIMQLSHRLDASFAQMVDFICRCTGRVIIGGIGKSGIIARKIAATLNSTGTRALFLHPVEAMHGDLGIVSPEDVFVALSASGETDELNMLLPRIRTAGCPIIAFTGNAASTLATHSNIIIDVGVEKEACPLGLAPTCSTTAMLAMGDALAVVLINRKHFKTDDFKRFHPAGALGQRLARKVADIMLTGDAIPSIRKTASMVDAIEEMNRHSLGVILVLGSTQGLSDPILRINGKVARDDVNQLAVVGDSDGRCCVYHTIDVLNCDPFFAPGDGDYAPAVA